MKRQLHNNANEHTATLVLDALHQRTAKRRARGVEGTSEA